MKTYPQLPPNLETRVAVEAIHAAHRLAAAAPRPDGVFHDLSFTATQPTSSVETLFDALQSNAPSELLRGYKIRNKFRFIP
jgi:hypothetical protein